MRFFLANRTITLLIPKLHGPKGFKGAIGKPPYVNQTTTLLIPKLHGPKGV
jgi:hypothetical protein